MGAGPGARRHPVAHGLQRRLDDASSDFRQAFELAEGAGFPYIGALALAGVAAVAAVRGDAVEAALVLGRAEELRARMGYEPSPAESALFEDAREGARAALGDERLEALLEEGRNRPNERVFPSDRAQ